MEADQFRDFCKYTCIVLVLILIYVLYQGMSCPSCQAKEHYQMVGKESTLAQVAKDAKFQKYILTPEPMPYTTESASGIPIDDIQAQKMFTVLPPSDYRINDTYALGGADEAIYLAQTAYNDQIQQNPVYLAQSGTVPDVPEGGATDDLRIVQQYKLNRLE